MEEFVHGCGGRAGMVQAVMRVTGSRWWGFARLPTAQLLPRGLVANTQLTSTNTCLKLFPLFYPTATALFQALFIWFLPWDMNHINSIFHVAPERSFGNTGSSSPPTPLPPRLPPSLTLLLTSPLMHQQYKIFFFLWNFSVNFLPSFYTHAFLSGTSHFMTHLHSPFTLALPFYPYRLYSDIFFTTLALNLLVEGSHTSPYKALKFCFSQLSLLLKGKLEVCMQWTDNSHIICFHFHS